MSKVALIESSTGRTVCADVIVADRFWSRLVGLQFRRPLTPGQGLLLLPCSSIHTFFMRFSLDLVMLDDAWQVVEVRRNVAPWRIVVAARSTHAVLEMAAGSAAVEVGERLKQRSAVSQVVD